MFIEKLSRRYRYPLPPHLLSFLHYHTSTDAQLPLLSTFPHQIGTCVTLTPTCTQLLLLSTFPHQNGVFVTVDEPTLTHHDHLKFMGYSTVYSWSYSSCYFCGLGQMYNDLYPSLQYYRIFIALNPLLSAYSSLLPIPGNN